jgi:alpha-tubulin suppressor-like RCC1 family protein
MDMSELFNEPKKMKLFAASILTFLLLFAAGCVQSASMNDSSNNGSQRYTAIASFASIGDTGLALRSDGTVVCWGTNYEGSCEIPKNLTNVKSISSMKFAVKKDGTVAAWGKSSLNPVVPPNLTHVVAITRSRFCNIALKDDGTVVAWRAFEPSEFTRPMSDAQLSIIKNQSDLASISGNLGLKKDGTIVTWSVNNSLQSPSLPDLSNIIAISNQWERYIALRKDGTVVAFRIPDMDSENAGQVIPIHIVENFTDIRAVSTGFDHSLALKRDGTVVSWTDDSLQPLNLTDIVAISSGDKLDLALKNDGTIVAWGDNTFGQLFTQGNLSGVTSISSEYGVNLVMRNDGTIATWGNGFENACCVSGHEPEGIRNVTGILANGFQNIILENNTTIYGWGDPEYGPILVKRIPHPYLTIFGGNNALFALNKNRNLVVLSYNTTCYNISQRLDNVTDISSVNGHHTIALKNDGTVAVWGDSLFGQSDLPANLTGVMSVSTMQNYDLALKRDGTVVGWGENAMGQTDVPEGLSDATAIAAGLFHSLALKKDGTVVCWGSNKYGECNVPENLHDVTAIAAGEFQSLALKKDGTVVAWGQTVIPDWSG